MGSSKCLSDQRCAICCLWFGDGNIRASLFQNILAGPSAYAVGHLCAMLMC